MAELIGVKRRDGDALGLGVRQMGPEGEGRSQKQKQSTATQGAGGGGKAVGVKAGMGVVDQIIEFLAQQSRTGGEGAPIIGSGTIG